MGINRILDQILVKHIDKDKMKNHLDMLQVDYVLEVLNLDYKKDNKNENYL